MIGSKTLYDLDVFVKFVNYELMSNSLKKIFAKMFLKFAKQKLAKVNGTQIKKKICEIFKHDL